MHPFPPGHTSNNCVRKKKVCMFIYDDLLQYQNRLIKHKQSKKEKASKHTGLPPLPSSFCQHSRAWMDDWKHTCYI